MISRFLHWPLYVHAVIVVWLAYVGFLVASMPDHWERILSHVFILSVPSWWVGRATAGRYDNEEP